MRGVEDGHHANILDAAENVDDLWKGVYCEMVDEIFRSPHMHGGGIPCKTRMAETDLTDRGTVLLTLMRHLLRF